MGRGRAAAHALMTPLELTYLNGPDVDRLALGDDEILDAQVAEDHVTFVLREDDPDDGNPFQSFSMDEDPHLRRNGNSPH